MPVTAHSHSHKARNPLRRDPTRTGLIVKAFVAEIKKRMRALAREVAHFMVTTDALAVGATPSITTLARRQPRQFEFHTDDAKLQAFNDWFREQVEAEVFELVPQAAGWTGPWTGKYVQSAYKSGLMKAYASAKAKVAKANLGAETSVFLRDALNSPEAVSKVRLLATRSFENLRGITSQMGAEMNRILAQGMVDGRGAEAIAKEMTDRIDELSDARALRLARTEIVYTHAEGQLDAFEELGLEEVTVNAEWSTAGDDRVCPQCEEFEGQVFTIEEAHGKIPLHPNCRCAWIPAL